MFRKMYEKIVCADGFTMSVQASEFSYCTPRKNLADIYTEVEVGYPSHPEDLLMEYAEDPDRPTDTVYAWVPCTVVTTIIAKHGGVVEGEAPPGVALLEAIKNVDMQV